MADCTYCGKGYEPRANNPMGRCGHCGPNLVYDHGRLTVYGSMSGETLMVCAAGERQLDRIGAMRLRDELDHWLASTVDYETTASTEGEVVSTGRPRDLEAVR